MTLTKTDKKEIREMIREALMEPQDTAVELPKWEPGKILKVKIDGEDHKIALNPYWYSAKDGERIEEFTWGEAMALDLPDGWRIPSRHEMVEILEQLGQNDDGDLDGTLAETTSWSGYFWSTTEYSSSVAWGLYVKSSAADVYGNDKSDSLRVVCYR